ncbi:hypothetical protein COB57_02790 [Candidatus Peregrinibacteria bacterium]|nr:MAG: hypothetical protein COB57_02790 [Candidatus Peregrinibacteria bacterium]
MMYQVQYTKKSISELKKLPKETAKRILDKIQFFTEQLEPLSFAKSLKNPVYGMYRFRIGDYRVIFDMNEEGELIILYVLSVKHRKDVYK